jgi:hypothetical protein
LSYQSQLKDSTFEFEIFKNQLSFQVFMQHSLTNWISPAFALKLEMFECLVDNLWSPHSPGLIQKITSAQKRERCASLSIKNSHNVLSRYNPATRSPFVKYIQLHSCKCGKIALLRFVLVLAFPYPFPCISYTYRLGRFGLNTLVHIARITAVRPRPSLHIYFGS